MNVRVQAKDGICGELPNLNEAMESSPDEAQELKEAVCDSIVNAIVAKVSGDGEFGAFVFGQRPRDQFTSSFLLNQVSASGEDESSDIRIAVHGASLKLRKDMDGILTVQPTFAVYVRLLPAWEDLENEVLGLRPKPRLRRDAKQEINAEAASRRDAAVAGGDKRDSRVIFQEKVREVLVERGARFNRPDAPVLTVFAEETPAAEQEDVSERRPPAKRRSRDASDGEAGGHVSVAETAEGAEYPDDLCTQEEIPLKFKRLAVEVPHLSLQIAADPANREADLAGYAATLRRAIETAYDSFLAGTEGRAWAWRNVRVPPSAFRSRQDWDAALARIRTSPPAKDRLWPAQQPEMTVEWATHPAEPEIIHAAIGLLHRSCNEVGETYGDGGLYQVRLSIEISPGDALIPYVLERIKPAYDIHGFHTVAAAGWNSGVVEQAGGATTRLSTTWSPRYILPRIVPNKIDRLDLRFSKLADPNGDLDQLDRIPEAFDKWIELQRQTINPAAGVAENDTEARRREAAKFTSDIRAYADEVNDLKVGIALLKESKLAWQSRKGDPKAVPYRAWCLMNRAFAESGAKEGKLTWRLFQIGFVIANLVSPSTRMEEFHHYYAPNDASIESAALLYFATGGGKSEAFFGLLLFTLFLDRLRGKHRGVSALIRYPLRLLTAQQARRLARIMAKAEIIRRSENIPGASFEIGFWVGSGSTPNRLASGDKVLDEFKCIPAISAPEHRTEQANLDDPAYAAAVRDYNKLPKCPFCDKATALRRYPDEYQRLGIVCLSRSCEWNRATGGDLQRPLPFLLVDYDIYRAAPPVLLGTIDKLALIGQHWSTINRIAGMFGMARLIDDNGLLDSPYDLDVEKRVNGQQRVAPSFAGGVEVFLDPVPSLIIQDEAHLLEESLGTFAGLFETTLYNWFRSFEPIMGNRMAHIPTAPTEIRLPKVIVATATISDPQRQIRVLYQKQVRQFPHKGPRLYRSFYANPSEFGASAADRNRRLLEPDSKPKDLELYAPWARLYASLLTNGRPHTTASVMILGAFIAITTYLLRSLCSENPVRQLAASEFLRRHLSTGPLAGRHSAAIERVATAGRFDLLAAAVDLHRVALTYVTNKKGGDQILSALPGIADRQHRDFGADTVVSEIRTDLISGGVESGTVESIMRQAEQRFDPSQGDVETALRMIVATSAVSHGVDVENFNSMFFAGMPTAIDEFIQASSRIGRIHVGFSLLIPTPQNRRDRFILEVHEPFHRFLERMIAPPAIERWADRAILRIIPSLTQNWLIGKVYQEQFVQDDDPVKKRVRIFSKVAHVRSLVNRMRAMEFVDELERYILDCIGVDAIYGGAQSQRQAIALMVRERIREFVRLLEMPTADGDLHAFWEQFRGNIDSPMTSLRDVDAPGTVRPHVAARKVSAKERFNAVMRFIREGGTAREMVEVTSELAK